MNFTIKQYGLNYKKTTYIVCDDLLTLKVVTPNSHHSHINNERHLHANDKCLYVFDCTPNVKYLFEYDNNVVTFDSIIDYSLNEFANIINEFFIKGETE